MKIMCAWGIWLLAAVDDSINQNNYIIPGDLSKQQVASNNRGAFLFKHLSCMNPSIMCFGAMEIQLFLLPSIYNDNS